MSSDPLTSLVNENAEDVTESSDGEVDEKGEGEGMKNIAGADDLIGKKGGGGEIGGGRGVEDGGVGNGGKGEEGGKEEEGGRGGREEENEDSDKEVFSDVNLATPTSDRQGLEFFDHNVTSSDSSGIMLSRNAHTHSLGIL